MHLLIHLDSRSSDHSPLFTLVLLFICFFVRAFIRILVHLFANLSICAFNLNIDFLPQEIHFSTFTGFIKLFMHPFARTLQHICPVSFVVFVNRVIPTFAKCVHLFSRLFIQTSVLPLAKFPLIRLRIHIFANRSHCSQALWTICSCSSVKLSAVGCLCLAFCAYNQPRIHHLRVCASKHV